MKTSTTLLFLVCAIAAGSMLAWHHLPAQTTESTESTDPAASSNTETGNIILQSVSVMEIDPSVSPMVPHRYTATIVARRTSDLSFQASERIEEILVDEGDKVTKDQVLAIQEKSAIDALFRAATARALQSQSVLQELEAGPRKETIEAARAELARLRAQLRLADANLKRQTRLRRTRASSEGEFDSARFERDSVAAASVAAKQNLAELVAGTRSEQLEAQRAAVKVAGSLVNQAKARLDQTEIRAPFSGRISRRYLDEGSIPSPGAPVLELVESDHLEIRFGVSPEIAAQLSTDMQLSFTVGSSNKKLSGIVHRILPKLDRATRTQQVIVNVTDPENAMVDGQTVRIEFAIENKNSDGFWVPSEALQPQVRGLWSLLVIDTSDASELPTVQTVQRRDVETLATWGTWSRVRGTLEPTDRVIFEGGHRVSVGQKVEATSKTVTYPWDDGIQLKEATE